MGLRGSDGVTADKGRGVGGTLGSERGVCEDCCGKRVAIGSIGMDKGAGAGAAFENGEIGPDGGSVGTCI